MVGIAWELIDWDAISAIATTGATLVALGSSYLALSMPARERRRESRGNTLQLLHACREAVDLYQEALRQANALTWEDGYGEHMRIRARGLHFGISHLIARPLLEDGAITVCAGALSLLHALEHDVPLAADLYDKMNAQPHYAVVHGSPFMQARRALEQMMPMCTFLDQSLGRFYHQRSFPGRWRGAQAGNQSDRIEAGQDEALDHGQSTAEI